MLLIQFPPGSHIRPAGTLNERILEALYLIGNTQAYQFLRQGCFESRGSLAGSQAARNDVVIQDDNGYRAEDGKCSENAKHAFSAKQLARSEYVRIVHITVESTAPNSFVGFAKVAILDVISIT